MQKKKTIEFQRKKKRFVSMRLFKLAFLSALLSDLGNLIEPNPA